MPFGKSKGYCNQVSELMRAHEQILELSEKSNVYREALEQIVKHMELTAGGMTPVSGVYVIATKALTR